MMGIADQTKLALGFLTVVEQPQQGLCGGYLLLNRAGRPLEFHCTVPIKANRAQEILYGPTLAPFLYGEQIGKTLLAKAKVQPTLVCTDREPALAVQDLTDTPVLLIIPQGEGDAGDLATDTSAGDRSARLYRLDSAHKAGSLWTPYQLGRNRVGISTKGTGECTSVLEEMAEWLGGFDMWEPFARIRQAIEEAQKAAR